MLAHYDVVFMNCATPEVDPAHAATEMRRRQSETVWRVPIIGITVSASAEERRRAIAAGMDDCIGPPPRCAQCDGSGFRGRLGIFEVFEVGEQARALIMERRDGAGLRQAAIAAGMKTMVQDGLAKVLLGETTIDEVLRAAL